MMVKDHDLNPLRVEDFGIMRCVESFGEWTFDHEASTCLCRVHEKILDDNKNL